MNNIRIGFSASGTLISRLIRYLTNSKTSHSFIIYWDECWQRDLVIEADFGGYKIVSLSSYKPNTIIDIIKPKFDFEKELKFSIEWLGLPYDYSGLLGMSWVLIGRWIKKKWKNPLNDPKSLFCSEAISKAMKLAKYPGSETWDPSTITPNDLYVFFKKEVG